MYSMSTILAGRGVRLRTFSALLLTAFALLGGCASFDPHNVLGRHINLGATGAAQTGTTLSPATRAAAIEAVWSTVNDRYYRADLNGVDWLAARDKWQPQALAAATDDEFWERLDQMAGELADSHTRVESPRTVERRKQQQAFSLGLNIRDLGGELTVLSVHAESDAWWAGVRPGMTLARVAGRDAREQWRDWSQSARKTSSPQAALRLPLRKLNDAAALAANASGPGLALEFARADGEPLAVTLKPATLSTRPTVSHRTLPSGLGYIRLTAFNESLRERLLEGVNALRDTPGIIVDLRGNGGGSAAMAEALIGSFFKAKTVIGKAETRTGQPVTVAFGAIKLIGLERSVPGRADAYTGKVAVIVDSDSASASEATAGGLQSTGRAVVVGETSCGCLLAYLGYAALPGGGELAYSEIGFATIRGDRIEGRGVVPDIAVGRTRDDVRASRDRALELAQAALLK
jgi:carboxyl-terminal processing protease